MDAVEEVKSRLNIEDVIGEYVLLKRAGRNFKGLSPFSNEKTPSFMVSPEKQIWHDFSSGKGGTVFSFVMEVEGLDFKGALELLARKAGVDLDQFKGQGKKTSTNNKEKLYSLLDAATNFFQIQLTKNEFALRYVRETREYSKETILEWRLGYAPNTSSGLIEHLSKKGFTVEDTKKAGLLTLRRGKPSDMFRDRLIIPLADAQGRVIGFTARLLHDDENAPKYINTPSTSLYDKSRHVYGLHLAKSDIRKNGFVVVTEGNLDVISSHQAGVRQVVASAGTAITEKHFRELKRFTGDVRICFDADEAGLNATERVIPIANKLELNLSIINLPSTKDPDDLIREDPDKWIQAIIKPSYVIDWLIERYTSQIDIATGQGKREFTDVMLGNIRMLNDPVEKDHYINIIASKIGVNSAALQEKLQINSSNQRKSVKKSIRSTDTLPDAAIEQHRSADHFLALCLMQARLREMLSEIKADMITHPPALQLYHFLREHKDFNGNVKDIEGLRDIADYVRILTLIYEELYAGLEFNELRNEATRSKSRVIEDYVKREKGLLSTALSTAGDAEARKLLIHVKKLNNLLKKSQRR